MSSRRIRLYIHTASGQAGDPILIESSDDDALPPFEEWKRGGCKTVETFEEAYEIVDSYLDSNVFIQPIKWPERTPQKTKEDAFAEYKKMLSTFPYKLDVPSNFFTEFPLDPITIRITQCAEAIQNHFLR